MNRNWSNQKANPALKNKTGNKYILQYTKYYENKLLFERAAISQKVATQQLESTSHLKAFAIITGV